MEIRLARREDVPAVIDLVRTTLAEFDLDFGQGAQTDAQLSSLPQSYEVEGGAFFVAVEGSMLLGTAGVAMVAPGVFELRKMYLAPASRGRGLGQALFERCLNHARAKGAHQLVLDTTEKMTAAIAFYERNGFTRDDSQRRAARCSRGYVKTL
jgi:putative acetyltransferase